LEGAEMFLFLFGPFSYFIYSLKIVRAYGTLGYLHFILIPAINYRAIISVMPMAFLDFQCQFGFQEKGHVAVFGFVDFFRQGGQDLPYQ
jgi:hypothetical protein